jgi:hypothetical protein
MSAESARACAGHALRTPPGLYRPRHPERTVLHAVVREHLETWLALKREGELDAPTVPGFVERDFRKVPHLWRVGSWLRAGPVPGVWPRFLVGVLLPQPCRLPLR